MSSINFRLYGEQIYGLYTSYLKDYLNQEINKEKLISDFKNGSVDFNEISTKKNILIHPQINITELLSEKIHLNIPDDKENFSLKISKLKLTFLISELSENEIKILMINQKQKLIENFIEYAIKKVENSKSSPSFLEGLLDSLMKRLLSGFLLEIGEVIIFLKCQKNIFLLKIGNVSYKENNGIEINNISLSLQQNQIPIIPNFNVLININKQEKNKTKNSLDFYGNNLIFGINENTYKGIVDIVNSFKKTKYMKNYIRTKALINFHKPSKDLLKSNKKEYYKALWFFSVKTVINLIKYKSYKKKDVFELLNCTQQKIVKKIIDDKNNNNNDNILYPEDIYLLEATKNDVEKKVIENKSGNALANAFKFFFNNDNEDDENKKKLTDDERKIFDEIYEKNNLIEYLCNKGKMKEKKENDKETTLSQIKNFFNDISLNFDFSKIQLFLFNNSMKNNIYISDINFKFFITNKHCDCNFILNDFGINNKSVFIEKNKNLNMFNYEKNNEEHKIDFGFKSIFLTDNIILSFCNFYYSVINSNPFLNEFYYFSKKKLKTINEEKTENPLRFIDHINISNFPSITIATNQTSLKLDIKQFSIQKTKINFILNIKENNTIYILNNYEIIIQKNESNNKFYFDLSKKINISLSYNITNFIFIFMLKLNKLKQYYTNVNTNTKLIDNNLLYNFKYVLYKNVNVNDKFLSILNLNLISTNIEILVAEKLYQTKITLINFSFCYKDNKNLLLKFGNITINTSQNATFILYLFSLHSPLYSEYEKNIINMKTEYNININNEVFYNEEIKQDINIRKTNLINQIFNGVKIFMTEIHIYYQVDKDNYFSINLNKTIGNKIKNIFRFCSENCYTNLHNNREQNNVFKILALNEKFYIDYDYDKHLTTVKINLPKININVSIIQILYNSFSSIMEQENVKSQLTKKKYIMEISNIGIIFNKFCCNISKMEINNYGITSRNNMLIKITNIIVKRNDNKSKIINLQEKQLKIDYKYRPKTQQKLTIESYLINMIISQKDLYYLIVSFLDNSNIIYKGFNYFKIDTRSVSDKSKKKNINIICNIPNLNFSLCLNNNYSKLAELSLRSTKLFLNYSNNFDINSNNIMEIIDYKISVKILLLKYYDNNNNELQIFKSDSSIQYPNDNIHHIEFVSKKNNKDISLMINKSELFLRADSFLGLYYYFKNGIPLSEIKTKMQNNKKMEKIEIDKLKIQILSSKLMFPSSYYSTDKIIFDVNDFLILFDSVKNNKFPFGIYNIKLVSVSSSIYNENNVRKIFYSSKNFLNAKLNLDKANKLLSTQINMDSLIINLSYTDITFILKTYLLNKILFNNEKKLINTKYSFQEKSNLINKNKNTLKNISINLANNFLNFVYILVFNFYNYNITLIDNSSGSYYPFMNLKLSQFNLEYKSKTKSLDSNFNLILSSYNYISCVFEPTIEKLPIHFTYKNENANENFCISIKQLNVNLSDMSISFTLVALNNWIKNFIKNFKEYKEDLKNNYLTTSTSNNKNYTYKITNNIIINNTGERLQINYAKNNYILEPYQQILLDYINEWDINKYGPKQINLKLSNNNNNMIFNVPIEKICTRLHRINDNIYIISENVLSKDRQININLHSPVIFKNKSIYPMKINIFNNRIGNNNNNYFLLLNPNSVLGLPLIYYCPNTFFNFVLLENDGNMKNYNQSIKYNLDEIMNSNDTYNRNMIIDDKIFLLKLVRKIPSVRTIIVVSEHSVINCLPCDIYMEANNKGYLISKCTEQFIDCYSGNDLDINFQISLGGNIYYSQPKKLFQLRFNENGNFLKFFNRNNSNDFFSLSLIFKNTSNTKKIIIFAESILVDESGINFQIRSRNGNCPLCYYITKNIYLMSSNVDPRSAFFNLSNEYYKSKNICLDDIMKSSPYYTLKLKDNIENDIYNRQNNYKHEVTLIINNSISNVTVKNNPNLKENIITMIYKIYPSYRITNLLSTKNFIISYPGENKIVIPPLTQINFNCFNKGSNANFEISITNLDDNYNNYKNNMNNYGPKLFMQKINFSKLGIYSFCVNDNMSEYLFNVEIRESTIDGLKDVFILETTFENAKIIIDNQTENLFNITQVGFESFNQIIQKNEKQILKIYNQKIMEFNYQTNNNFGEFKFEPFVEIQNKIEINNDIILYIESNGIKMKLTFYYKIIFDDILSGINKYCFYIKISDITLSMIGDNEYKNRKLRDYKRNEIVLLNLNNFFCNIRWDRNIGLLGKEIIKLDLIFERMGLYNQNNKKDYYISPLYNQTTPFISSSSEIYFFKNDNVSKINKLNFNVGNLILNIDPIFLDEIMDFAKNIIYRMKIKNFNVDEIFINNYTNDNINSNSLDTFYNQDKIKKYIEEYKKQGIIFHGKDFELPQLSINFVLSDKGLEEILTSKFGYSSFLIWCTKGLVNTRNDIILEKSRISSYMGNLNGMLKIIMKRYKSQFTSQILDFGIQGFLGNIKKALNVPDENPFFNFLGKAINQIVNDNFDDFDENKNKNNKNNKNIKYGNNIIDNNNSQLIRKRIPRAFYGKFKYFKEFNQDDAYYYEKINSQLQKGYSLIFDNFIMGNNEIYVFSASSLMVMNKNANLINEIYYYYIDKAYNQQNMIIVNYNQEIEGKTRCMIKLDNDNIADKVAQILNEETSKNRDNFNDIS